MALPSKKILFILSSLLVVSSVSARLWTLNEAIEKALSENPDAVIAQASLERAQAISEQADATLYPKIAANLGYSQTDNPMMSFGNILNQGTFDNSIDFNSPGRTDAFAAGIYLKYQIFAGGTNTATREAADNIASANSIEKDVVYNNLKIETIRSFFAILQSELVKKSVLETIASLKQDAINAKNLEDSGKLLKSQRLNIDIQLLKANEALLSVSQQLELSKHRFATVLNLEEYGDIEVDEKALSSFPLLPPKKTEAKVRPEILALQKRIEAAGNNIDAQFGLYFPTVSLIGGYQYDKGWVRNGDNGSWSAGVMVEIPIFDGMLTRGRVREAKALEVQIRHELQKLEKNFYFEKEKARLAYELILEQEKLVAAQLEQARESLKLTQARFGEGLVLSVELLKAESSLSEIKIRRSILESSKAVALSELRRAYGLEIFER